MRSPQNHQLTSKGKICIHHLKGGPIPESKVVQSFPIGKYWDVTFTENKWNFHIGRWASACLSWQKCDGYVWDLLTIPQCQAGVQNNSL